MSRLAGRMPKGLAQSLTAPAAATARRPVCLALRTVPVRYSSTEPPPNKPRGTGPSFQGQLTHSIMKRLARERSDLERIAKTRPESKTARNFSLTFGRDYNSRLFFYDCANDTTLQSSFSSEAPRGS